VLSGWKILSRSSLKASCALDHFYLTNNVPVNYYDLHRLILMGPNRSPQFGYLYTLLPLNFWVVSTIALCGFRC
jgi:hypothetical protein